MKYIRLGDLLVKSGTITQGQLDEALALFPENAELRGKAAASAWAPCYKSTASSPRSS